MNIENTPLLPGKRLSFQIPEALAKEFAKELRVVFHPDVGTVGMVLPERLIPDELKGLEGFDIVITPHQFER